jgi:putative DNA primase/helicase
MNGSNQNLIAIPERGSASIIDTCGANGHSAVPIVDSTDPSSLARSFVALDEWRLQRHEKDWRRWDGSKYVLIDEEYIKADLWKWLEGQWPLVPTPKIVRDVLEALKYIRKLPLGIQMPTWIGPGDFPNPDDIIAFENGLLDVSGEKFNLLPHTPYWLSPTCLLHPYEPEAECPAWVRFLGEVFEGDQERIRALQQWFGYNLTWDIRQHKFVLLIGPPRSGKTTILGVLRTMLGDENVTTPTLTALGNRLFALESFVGKMAAIVPDAHLDRSWRGTAVLERLKSIVGGDHQNVERKRRSELSNLRITTRFSIAANELPQLPDTATALRNRMIILPFNRSFAGQEDFDLGDRLADEMPGIIAWALRGLRDLRVSARLHQPAAGRAIIDDFARLTSPVKEFLEDCCVQSPDAYIPSGTLWAAWRDWCRMHGHHAGNSSRFGEDLRATFPAIVRKRKGRDAAGRQVYHYRGVELARAEPGLTTV